jgi:hypothetical protein
MAEPSPPAPFCRFGVNLWERLPVRDFDLADLRAGWYVDYYAPGPPHPPELEYAPVLMLAQVGADGYQVGKSWAAIDALIAANPGAFWLIGNEPDRRVMQNDMVPAAYAAAYHDLYGYLKQRDPNAQVLAGNIVQATPLRLQYLDLVLAAYRQRYGEPLPVDGWSIHNFILNERSCAVYPADCWGAEIPPGITATEGLVIGYGDTARIDLFTAQIERFRRWMAANGYRNRPLYVTEYGVLLPAGYGYGPEVVVRYMHQTFDYLLAARDPQLGYAPDDNRLVQRFSWFAVIEPRFNGGLFESIDSSHPISPPFTLSPIGLGYRDYTRSITPSTAIGIVAARLAPPHPLHAYPPPDATGADATGAITATLDLTVSNSGNLQAAAVATVTLYAGAPAPGGAPLAPPQAVALGGCGQQAHLRFAWRSASGGPPEGFLTVLLATPQGTVTSTLPYFVQKAAVFVPFVANNGAPEATSADSGGTRAAAVRPPPAAGARFPPPGR